MIDRVTVLYTHRSLQVAPKPIDLTQKMREGYNKMAQSISARTARLYVLDKIYAPRQGQVSLAFSSFPVLIEQSGYRMDKCKLHVNIHDRLN